MVGGRTLEIFAGTPKINAWMYSKFARHVRGDVLEVGSGLGNISQHLTRDANRVVLTDIEDHYLEHLKRELADGERVQVARFVLGEEPPELVRGRRFDAIVAINVIEHVQDDVGAVRTLASLLKPNGYLLAYVPACAFAFGTLDEALGHFRRYSDESFAELLRAAGLDPGKVRYVNPLGLPGWVLNGRLLRRRALPARQVAMFERIVPLVAALDHLRLPIGLGVVACARRQRGGAS